jgi:Zn-dependent M32 family carboxypeptidase
MRVPLSEKSKAEFIELINKDSITCWFEGDEFVMPSGQGKTAKGIVLGKLSVYRHQQSKVDKLQNNINLLNEALNIKEQLNQKLREREDELQKRVDAAFRVLSQLNALDDEAHKRWKREACMFSQGESNAYEHAVRLLEQALKGGGE